MKTKVKSFIVYTLYYIGDILSKSFNWDLGVYLFFKSYNWCMIKSLELQEKWNLEEPWIKPEENGKAEPS